MNPAHIKLTVAQGRLNEKEYAFEEPVCCTVGRAEDCNICVPDQWENMDVSRHHCEFEIDPPTIWVRDLQSHNGTFVNGEKIGQRPRSQSADEVARTDGLAYELKDGDEVRAGHIILRVGIGKTADAAQQQVPLYFV
jgi:eukaryotic-like serine/threonine-protein kinase